MFIKNFHRILPGAFALCLFAFILGVRWAVFDRFGMTLPEWDQWDAEGIMLLAPWYSGDHFLQALFSPHNEHRVVLTKLLNLGLTLANGQWDQKLEATFNALFPATIAVSFFILARRHLNRRWLAPLTIFLGIIFAFPFAWQNVLGGFHSQQFFLVGLALVAIALLPFNAPFSLRWWLGSAAAALALFSMASGFFGAVVVIGLLGVQYFRRERTLASALPTLAVCAFISAIGWFTRHEFPPHAPLKAQNLHDFAFTIIRSLQWPAPASTWFALILWLPWTWLVARVVFSSRPLSFQSRAFGYFILGLGVWVWLQLVATAYARGAGGPPPASRYIDTLVFGIVANALALVWLSPPDLLPRIARRTLAVAALAWLVVFSWGAQHELRQIFTGELPPVKTYHDYCEVNVRNYLYTGDARFLAHEEIPYPSAAALRERLDLPSLHALLPVTVRPPLAIRGERSDFVSSDQGTLPTHAPGLPPGARPLNYRATWGSYTPGDLITPREFTSAPLRAPLGGWLKFETSGSFDESGVILELRDAASGQTLDKIRPDKSPGATWRAAYVPAPSSAFVIYARAPDAARWLAFSGPVEMGRLSYLAWRLSQHGLLIAQIAAGLALGFCSFAFITRRHAPPATPPPPESPSPSPRTVAPKTSRPVVAPVRPSSPPLGFLSIALAVCLFFTIWGAKLIAIDHYGSDLPYWDQWGKEGELVLTPWFERHELWKNLFVPHNEHRIAPTLALNLALVTGGGQWDARVQCVVSGMLHAAMAVGLFIWAVRRFPRGWALAAGIVLIFAIAPPIAWENVLGGFQSQFYFLAGFSLLALHLLLNTPALSARWLGGLACGLLALVSMGSGLLVAAPLLAILTVRLFAKSTSRRDTVITLAAGLLIAALGAWLRTPTPWHDTLHAKTASGFITFAARCLSWPLPQHFWLAPLIWLPWFAVLFLRVKDLCVRPAPALATPAGSHSATPPVAATTDFLIAAGGWVLLQIAAVSFSRASGGSMPASRYGDIAAFGLVLCFFSLAHLAASRPLLSRRVFTVAGASWLGLVTICVALATRDVIASALPDKKTESVIFERSVQAFVLTDDYDAFDKSPRPFPFTDWLARILRNPKMRAVLPTSVRAPLRVENFPTETTSLAPVLTARRIHTLATAGGWRSAPVPAATLGWWRIETAGPAFSASSSPLRLVAPTSSVFITPSVSALPSGWQPAYLSAPREPVSFVATTDSSQRWLAFTEPVEMSSLSYYTWQLAKKGTVILIAALAGFIVVLVLSLRAVSPARDPRGLR